MSTSPLLNRILADIKESMKARDQQRLNTLRTLHSDIKNVAIDSQIDISDEICLDMLTKTLKQKSDSIEQFKAGGRDDLVKEERAKAELLKGYLPKQLTAEELDKLVREAITEAGATSKKEMGQVMKILSSCTKGRADGKTVSALVQKILG